MPKFFVKDEQINQDKVVINNEDVKHIKNVLRMKKDDEIQICNVENSKNYICIIENIEDKQVMCKIKEEIEDNTEPEVEIHILQGLPKAEKMEYIIQKTVEIGVKEITPIEMERSIVRLDEKDKIKKVQRWQKISEVAAKQSGRNCIPKINNVINIKKIYENLEKYDIIIVAYENEKNNTLKNELKRIPKKSGMKVAVLIGPEGGISDKEIEQLKQTKSKIVTLGNRILRTETVALVVSSIIIYELEG